MSESRALTVPHKLVCRAPNIALNEKISRIEYKLNFEVVKMFSHASYSNCK